MIEYIDQAESTNLLYTELLQQVINSNITNHKGMCFYKRSDGYWYLEIKIGSQKTQYSIGSDNNELQKKIKNIKKHWEENDEVAKKLRNLVAMLRAGGADVPNAPTGRVFEVLEQSGAFKASAIIVGSHAFSAYANMLGIKWTTALTKTHDIDLAGYNRIALALYEDSAVNANVETDILNSDLGFTRIMQLNHKHPSTSFTIHKKEMHVDILTPMIGKPVDRPILVHSLNTYAQPLRFLDYLFESVVPAVVIYNAGILINVPHPARFALHKLVISQRRINIKNNLKAKKDIKQASALLHVLSEDRPGDISLAWDAATKMPEKFLTQLEEGMEKLEPQLADKIKVLI